MNTSAKRAAGLCALLATTCLVTLAPAVAETKLVNTPAEKFIIAPGGVDMRTGRYVYSETDLAIGPQGESGALALTRMMANYVAAHANPFGNFSHNWDIMLLETRVDLVGALPVGNDYRMNVHVGGRSLTFEGYADSPGYGYKSDGPAAFLTFSGGTKASATVIYTFAGPDGTTMTFRPMGGEDCADSAWGSGRRRCAFISEMVQPDGTKYNFDYSYDGNRTGNRARLRRVTSSRGYALLLEGSGNLVTKACVLNLTQSMSSADGLCPLGAPATASYGYDNNGITTRLYSATDPTGGVSMFTYAPFGTSQTAMNFIKPGQPAPWLTNIITIRADEEDANQETIDSQTFADGQSYSYQYGFTPFANNKPNMTVAGGSYSDAAGGGMSVLFDFPILPGTGPTTPCTRLPCAPREPDDELNSTYQQTPGPVSVTDALGRTTTSDYCDPAAMAGLPASQQERCIVIPLQSFTDPDGIKTALGYDGKGFINKVTRYPKPGQEALGTIVTSASYACVNAKSCAKPTSVTDARNNTTTYTYAPEHGGVLTETGPAVNGIRPQKRYTYAQRYAWVRNASGGWSPAASPVWLLTSMSFCRTSAATGNPAAACATAGDEVLTSYDYGPDGPGPNNLLLRGTVVTADGRSLRTCQSYDAMGRRISETGAGADLAACQ